MYGEVSLYGEFISLAQLRNVTNSAGFRQG